MVTVSVLTPVHNGEEFIGEALRSVAASLFSDYEHIVVNDGSTDNTMEEIRKTLLSLDEISRSKVRVFSKEKSGEAETDNFALQQASGEFVVVLNADDTIGPELMDVAVKVLNSDAQLVVAYPDWSIIDKHGSLVENVKTPDFSVKKLVGRFECIPGPGAIMRKSCIGDDLLRDPAFPLMADYECWLRLSLKGGFVRIPEIHAQWRIHGQNASVVSRGAQWASEAVRIALHFLENPAVTGDRQLRRLASLGLSRAYLLASLHVIWDDQVPAVDYLLRSLWLGLKGGRLIALRDIPLVRHILYKSIMKQIGR